MNQVKKRIFLGKNSKSEKTKSKKNKIMKFLQTLLNLLSTSLNPSLPKAQASSDHHPTITNQPAPYIYPDILENINKFLTNSSLMTLGRVNKAFNTSTSTHNKNTRTHSLSLIKKTCPPNLYFSLTNNPFNLVSNSYTSNETLSKSNQLTRKAKCITSITNNIHSFPHFNALEIDFLDYENYINLTEAGEIISAIELYTDALVKLFKIKKTFEYIKMSRHSIPDRIFNALKNVEIGFLHLDIVYSARHHSVYLDFARNVKIKKIYANNDAFTVLFKEIRGLTHVVIPSDNRYTTQSIKEILKLPSLSSVNLNADRVKGFLKGVGRVEYLRIDRMYLFRDFGEGKRVRNLEISHVHLIDSGVLDAVLWRFRVGMEAFTCYVDQNVIEVNYSF